MEPIAIEAGCFPFPFLLDTKGGGGIPTGLR